MRQSQLLLVELFLIAVATVSALVLRDNFELSEARLADLAPYLAFTLAAAAVVFPALRTSCSVWRFTATADYLRIFVATGVTVVGAAALGFAFNRMDGVARALPVLQGLLILFSLVGVRVLMRLWHAAPERPVKLGAPKGTSVCEIVFVVGVGGLANLYLRSVAQFASDRVRIAGLLLGHDHSHIGRSIQGHPILGTPEQIADALRVLEIDGVFVDRIVVAMAFEKLSSQAQGALPDIEKGTNISLDFLIDQMGLGLRSSGKAENDSAGVANSLGAFSFGAEDLAAMTRRRYWRVKRALDFIGAAGLQSGLVPFAARGETEAAA